MSHVLAIARREIEERAFVFVAAIGIALASLVALAIPHGTFADRRSAVVMLGSFLGVAFTWALALILGATLIGRELSENRLSFYFTRPIGGSAVWFGKLLGALVLLAVSFAIVNVIPLGIGVAEWRMMSSVSRQFAVIATLAAAVVLMLGSHVISTWIRSRSPIIGLDFVASLIAAGVFIAIAEPLLLRLAFGPFWNVVTLALAALLIAAIGGGAWQLSRGRIDARRNHRELSIFVWIVVFIAAIAMFAYSRWVLAATPKDFTEVGGFQRGNMIEAQGAARGFYPEFVINSATGAFVPAGRFAAESGDMAAIVSPSSTFENANIAFSRSRFGSDGGVPADWTLTIVRLAQAPEQIAVLPLSGHVEALGVSSDGSRAAVVIDDILTVYDTRSRHALASSRIGRVMSAVRLEFVAPDTVRAFLPSESTHSLTVRDFNVATRQWTNVAGPLPILRPFFYRVAGPILATRDGSQVEIRDLRNPSVVQTLPVDKDDGIWLLRDGGQAIYHYGSGAYVEIRHDGIPPRRVPFGADIQSVRIAGELADGRLVLTAYAHAKMDRFDTTTYLFDPRTGGLGTPMPHVSATVGWPAMLGISDATTHRALLHRNSGKIDVVDLQTGVVRPLN
jgi:ABC-type transport system involved in multi-copper enzyme maturation permease subunit